MTALTSDDLVLAQRGDEQALARIYRALAPVVIGYLRGQGAAEPEDVASEVFVGVVRGLPRFQGDMPAFRSWVFSIAHRRLQDERRKRARRPLTLVDPERTEELAPPGGDTEDEAIARLGGIAGPLLARLTPDQRDVILLRVIADLPVAEVARVLSKRQGAVKTLHRRALARLARFVDPVS